MKQIEQLAQAAIGVDSQRGDVLAVENLSFQQAPWKRLRHRPKRAHGASDRALVVGAALYRPGGVVSGGVLAGTASREEAGARRIPRASGQSGRKACASGSRFRGRHALGAGEGGLAEGGKRANQLKRMLTEKVKAEPEAASRLVQGWVQGEGRVNAVPAAAARPRARPRFLW